MELLLFLLVCCCDLVFVRCCVLDTFGVLLCCLACWFVRFDWFLGLTMDCYSCHFAICFRFVLLFDCGCLRVALCFVMIFHVYYTGC